MFGSSGSWALSEQLALYRTMDGWEQNRADNSLALNDAAWRSQYDNLVNQYNRLLNDANRLADVKDRELAEKDRQIAALTAANRAHESSAEKTALDLAGAKASVRLLRGIVRELRPDVYPEYDEND